MILLKVTSSTYVIGTILLQYIGFSVWDSSWVIDLKPTHVGYLPDCYLVYMPKQV